MITVKVTRVVTLYYTALSVFFLKRAAHGRDCCFRSGAEYECGVTIYGFHLNMQLLDATSWHKLNNKSAAH